MNWSQTVQSNQTSHQYQIRQSRGQPTQPPQPQQTQPPYRSSNPQPSTYRQPYDTSRYHPSSSRGPSTAHSSIPPSHGPSHPQSLSSQPSKPAPQPLSNVVNKPSVSSTDPSSTLNTVDTQPSSVPQDSETRSTTVHTEELQSDKQPTAESSDHKVGGDDTENTESKDTDLMGTDGHGATLERKESDDNPNDVDQQSLASGTTPKKKPFSSSNSVNAKMLFGTRYEVKCDETFAYYEGYVYDYDEEEKKLKVSYPWKADQTVPVNYVRPLARPVEINWKPKQGDHVECQAKAEESEPYGWWDCIIKTVRDNLYLITYEGWDNHHEVLQHNMLRPYNDQEPFEDDGIIREFLTISRERINEFKATGDLSAMNMGKFGVSVDGSAMDVSQFNHAQRTISQLRRIASQTQLIHLNYSPASEKLVLVGKKQNVYDAKMLIKFVWDLRQVYRKKEESVKNEEKSKQAEYEELKTCVRIKFDFPIALTKYVIGTKGENILSAKSIEGVKHINVRNVDKDSSECLILATDHNAADEARDILEMQQDFELIPQVVRKELIGKDGGNIKRLEERSQVIKICTLDHLKYIRESNRNYYGRGNDNYNANYYAQPSFMDEEENDGHDPDLVKLIIIGPKEKVPFAKMLIKSEVASIQQKRKFIERQLIAKQEINSIHNGTGNKYADNEWRDQNQNQNNSNYRGGGGGGGYNNNGYGARDPYYQDTHHTQGGGPPQSMRRQRRKDRNTEQSSKNTAEFNYMKREQAHQYHPYGQQQGHNEQHGNVGTDYPELGTKNQGGVIENKDIGNENEMHHEDQGNANEISWLEHDAAGIAEDEEDEQRRQNDEEQPQPQQQRYESSARRYRGKGQRGSGGRQTQRQYNQNTKSKPRWKPKGASNQ